MIPHLAPELIHRIAVFVQTPDLKSLRCVCKSYKYAVDPVIFSTICVTAVASSEDFLKKKTSLLENLASSSEISTYVRELKIGDLSPEHRPTLIRVVDGRYVGYKPDVDDEVVKECTVKVEEYLRSALRSLVNVQRVEWALGSQDSSWIPNEIVDCLCGMQFLSELSVKIRYCKHLIPDIQRLSCNGLVKLSLSCDFFNKSYRNAASFLLTRNVRTLRDLRLEHTVHGEQMVFASFFSSVDFSGTTMQPLHLDALQLPGWTIVHALPPENIALHTLERLDIGSMSDDGWRSLQEAQVRLRHLCVEQVSEALFSYLESYSPSEGLETLHLNLTSYQLNDSHSTTFYEAVLPRHERTLKHVGIDGNYHLESGWALDISRAGLFSGYPLLETLQVGVRFTESDLGTPTRIIATLLQFAVSHPSLAKLTLCGVARAYGEWCGAQITESIHKRMREAVLTAHFDGSTANNSLRVVVGGSTFVMEPGGTCFVVG